MRVTFENTFKELIEATAIYFVIYTDDYVLDSDFNSFIY